MIEVVGINFKENGNIYYFDTCGQKFTNDTKVIVETEKGQEYGTVAKENFLIEEYKIKLPLRKVIRKAKKTDEKQYKKNQNDAKKALKTCQELINQESIKMFLIDANYTFDRDKLIFRFLAEGRVDFRQLAKDLAHIYKTRIELRQIGVRDKAKEIGGYGLCGQTLCCARFINDLNAVSINMAKNQNIALNPTKINGVCGRLMCCLKYEDEDYTNRRKKLPKIGSKIKTEHGLCKVIDLDILNNTYIIETKDKEIVRIKQNEDH